MVEDIESRIDADFAPADRDPARATLRRLADDLGGQADRVVRCVLFLAGGDLDRLRLFADESRRDWRDVIVTAELGEAPDVYRDFRAPFAGAAGPPGADARPGRSAAPGSVRGSRGASGRGGPSRS